MNEPTFTVSLQELVSLAVEHWRLTGELGQGSAGARHALRKIGAFLQARGVEAQGLEGVAYDAGMSATVVERVAGRGAAVVVETVAPLVTHQGRVVKAAEVVVAGG